MVLWSLQLCLLLHSKAQNKQKCENTIKHPRHTYKQRGYHNYKETAMFLFFFLGLFLPSTRAQWFMNHEFREEGKFFWNNKSLTYHKAFPGPSTPPGFGLREAIKTRQSRAYETATFADLIGRSMGGVSLQSWAISKAKVVDAFGSFVPFPMKSAKSLSRLCRPHWQKHGRGEFVFSMHSPWAISKAKVVGAFGFFVPFHMKSAKSHLL